MTRPIARSPLFHKGLTVYTSNGTALPRAEPSPASSTTEETEGSDNKVLPVHHNRRASDKRP